MVTVHEVVGAQSQNDTVLNLEVLGISQVLYTEKSLYLGDTLCRQVDKLVLLVDDEIAGLFALDTHDRIDLGEVLDVLTALHLAGENITCLINLGGLAALAGNDQRSSRFINEDGVDLVDDGVMELTDNELFLVDGHIVTQVVKAQLIIGHIGDIACIGRLALLGSHAVENDTDSHSHETIDLAHPLGITLCQIVVDCDDMDAATFKGIEVCGHGRDQRLTFTGTHFGNAALVQDNTADQLHAERLHIERAAGTLADSRIGLDKKVIQGLAVLESFSELCGRIRLTSLSLCVPKSLSVNLDILFLSIYCFKSYFLDLK